MKSKALLLCLALAGSAFAHEVPDDVRIHIYAKPIYAKPSGGKMQYIVRVPVNALIDTLLPMLPGPGYLDLAQSEAMLGVPASVWVSDLLTVYEGDTKLAKPRVLKTLLARQTDPSFNSYAEALAHVNGPKLPANSLVMWDRAVMDVLLETPIRSDRSDFQFVPRFGRLGVKVTTTFDFLPPGGGVRAYEYEGDPPPFLLNPSWDQSAAHFIEAGFFNITSQTDHLILVFCMVLLLRRYRALLPFVATFTAAHSVALIGSAYGLGPAGIWLPPLTYTLMALSVVYLALECVMAVTGKKRPRQVRWIAAIACGLVFGSGFWFALYPVWQFGGDHPLVSVLSFNFGIELGQLLALAVLVPVVNLFLRFVVAEQIGTLILAGIVAHMDWHRMVERAYALNRFESQLQWPVFDLRWMAAALLAAGLIWVGLHKKTLQPE
ncbi:MAG TPA: HupE/UreJ family protein [Bryobacteraceae bacterium]|jgi:hypothetical protein|nr:HupE/UreJ family protein [Bryobacteraceae bacterium]